jgi:hypothetical protein
MQPILRLQLDLARSLLAPGLFHKGRRPLARRFDFVLGWTALCSARFSD